MELHHSVRIQARKLAELCTEMRGLYAGNKAPSLCVLLPIASTQKWKVRVMYVSGCHSLRNEMHT